MRKNSVISEVVFEEKTVICQMPVLKKRKDNGKAYMPYFPQLQNFEVRQRGRAIGYLIAKRKGNDILIGWAAFNQNDKQFSRKEGRAIATARMNGRKSYTLVGKVYDERLKTTVENRQRIRLDGEVPSYMVEAIERFAKRCQRYFGVNSDRIAAYGVTLV